MLGTKTIVVLGHGNCGAVNARSLVRRYPGRSAPSIATSCPAVNQAGANLRAATEVNAKIQAQLLQESSPVLARLIKEGTLSVLAAFYDVESGKVTLLS